MKLITSLVFLMLVFGWSGNGEAANRATPNIVLIFIDDMGYADIGPFGNTEVKTPNLDRFAKEGMKFTSFYATPVCSMSRACLMTGCYNVRVSIPGAAVKPPLVDYYFEVLDGGGAVIANRGDASSPLRIAVPEPSSKGWILPVAIGGGVLGAAAIVGVLALSGVFTSSPSGGGATGPAMSTVSVSVGEASR